MRELHLNTDEQVTDYIERAWVIVDAAELPGELRGIAFARALDWLASKQVFADPADVQPIATAAPMMHIPGERRH